MFSSADLSSLSSFFPPAALAEQDAELHPRQRGGKCRTVIEVLDDEAFMRDGKPLPG